MEDIRPVILCGGTGSRLWPMSRTQSPKQFQPVAGKGSLTFFQATVQRHRIKGFGRPIVVTAAKHAKLVARQLQEIQCDAQIICEPMARNTGPAVLAAAMLIEEEAPGALMLVLPSDHIIQGNLNTPILAMRKAATDGRIVTFGIKPTYPETGYGYISDGGRFSTYDGLHRVAQFVEKPPLSHANALMQSGSAYWASGISLYSSATIIKEFARLDSGTHAAVRHAIDKGEQGYTGLLLHPDSFRRATSEPTERIIFEQSDLVALAPIDVEWSDVGCWTSMHAIGDPDEAGNVCQGDVLSIGTTNSLVRSDNRLVAVVGMSDVIVVDTPDAVLVTARGKCQDVKKVTETLRDEARRESHQHLQREHVWGQSQSVLTSPDYEMMVLKINPSASINIDPLPGRQIIAGRGDLEVFDGFSRRKLGSGERVLLEVNERFGLTNKSNDCAEVLLVTMNGTMAPELHVDDVSNG
ncbi:mannose-1-phosphate guanylyltransferase [Yoonia sp. 2307UL14-13]|uniref:mannose-1-phosphate guanylyltransferase n=1 Tax=Yoonia sp. 2307UL14-13 TaxID=3126506 RepID=UPI00309C5018